MDRYRYEFSESLDVTELEATVMLAVLATEALHGEPRVQLEAKHTFDAEQRTVVIDGTNEVGQDLNRLFLGFVRREFGPDSYQVQRVAETGQAAAGASIQE